MNPLTFKRDLSRTTLAPPLKRARFELGPPGRGIVREIRLCMDQATGEYLVRLADCIGGLDTGDDAESRHACQIDGWRAFKATERALSRAGRRGRRIP